MRNFLREEDGEAALSNRVLVPGTASIGINIGIDWYSKYWTNIFNTFRDPYVWVHRFDLAESVASGVKSTGNYGCSEIGN